MRRIGPNGFAIPFGLTAFGGTWLAAADARWAPRAVGEALFLVAAAVWVALVVAYGAHVATRPGRLRADLTHPVLAPFAGLVTATPMVLVARGLTPYAPVVATAATGVLIGLTVLHGAWLTGQLICSDLGLEQFHPGYLIPVLAGGLLASIAAAQVGQVGLAWALFGLGTIGWLVVGSIVLGRLFLGPRLPTHLVPTLAIEVAPSAVAGLAWFSLNGGRIDAVAHLLAGFGLFMVLVQVRLLPAFVRLRFSMGFWAFTFPWSAVATVALHWIAQTRPVGGDLAAALVLAATSLLVGGIAVRTAVALRRGTLFPHEDATAAPAPRSSPHHPSPHHPSHRRRPA